MKKNRTRKKLFFTCILFMCVFMVLFVAALQIVMDTAYIESLAEAEIKEMQMVSDVYFEFRHYYDESISLFSSLEYIKNDIIDVLIEINYADNDKAQLRADALAYQYSDYISQMDIFVVDKSSIIYLHTEDEEPCARIKKHVNYDKQEFLEEDDILGFLSANGVYEQSSTYKSSQVSINRLEYNEDVYIISIPRYDKIFEFASNEIVIYNKYGVEELRLNTEPLEKDMAYGSVSSRKKYRTHGIGGNRYVLCYYSNEDERGDYCLGVARDLDLSYRYIIYLCLLGFFIIISIGFWHWSEKVTKPLDFFLMWIKLVKDKDTLEEKDKVQMSMPKENYLLQNNIMLFFSFCLIPIVLAGAMHWYTENQILNGYIEDRYVESAEFYGHILDEHYGIWRDPVTVMCSDERLVKSLEGYQEKSNIIYDESFIQYIHEYSNVISDDVDRLTIYNAAGNVVVSSVDDFEDDRYIKYRVNIDDDYKWSFAEGLDTFVLHQKIYDDDGDVIGYCKLVLNNPELHINSAYNNDSLYSCYIYNYTDKIFSLLGSPNLTDEKVINMIRSHEEHPLVKSLELESGKVNYFYIVKEKIFFDKIWDKYVVAFMNVVFFLCIALLFAAGVLTRTTLNPIIRISNALYTDSPQVPMSTLLLGREEFALIVNRVKTLSEQVNTYAKEQKLLEAERYEHEKKRKDAEILTLQTQINPHFMYNIFSSIAVLIRTGQTEKATKMVMYTGNLMRMGLYRGYVMIPLKEEIEHVAQYINIQQIRYNNCMKVNINIDETLMQLKVVKFILQPIVENAIEHNVGYFDDRDLKIDINAFKKDDKLIIQVIDNGRGLEEEKTQKLQESINNFDMSNHLGLANINERIKLNCGNEYGITLDNNAQNGLEVELALPIVVEKEE